MDSTLSYFINQLDNFDPTLYQPLVSVSWGRDIDLRSGITMSNESTSFIRSSFGAPGTLNQTGNMPWISAETTAIPGVTVNGQRLVKPLRLLGREPNYSSVELQRSQLTGQPIDVQQLSAMNVLYQMNTDQMVYIGATEVGATGLLNSSEVTAANVAAGAAGGTTWATKTPDEILADVNTMLTAAWLASGYAVCPGKIGLPPANYSLIATQKVSSAGDKSILTYLMENNISKNINTKPLEIVPIKWLTGRGDGGSNRMICYTQDESMVRFPMVPIRRETAYYQGIKFFAPYIWAFGEMEVVYPETLRYADGI